MLCAESPMGQCHPAIWAWMANYIENIHLRTIKLHHWVAFKAPNFVFGDGNSWSWPFRDYWPYFERMILVTQGDETERLEARHYLEHRAVGTSEGVFRNMKCISWSTIVLPNDLHTLYLGMIMYLMDWAMSFLEQHFKIDEFNQHWALMPPYPGFAWFNKSYRQVMQWSGKEMKALGRLIVPDCTGTLLYPLASQRIRFTEALLRIKNLVYFHLMA